MGYSQLGSKINKNGLPRVDDWRVKKNYWPHTITFWEKRTWHWYCASISFLFFFCKTLNIVYICSSNRYMLTCYHSLIYWMITLFPYRLAITLFRLASKQPLQLYFDVAFYKQSPILRQKFNFTSLSQKDSQFASLNLLKHTDAYRTSFYWRYTKTVELSIWQSWKK